MDSNELELRRKRISALVDDIVTAQRALGPDVLQEEDRECYDILCRIERQLLAKSERKDNS